MLLTQVTRSVCQNNPAVQNEGMSFSHHTSCLSTWNGSGSWTLPHFPIQRKDDRKARLKRSAGPSLKCQRAENQTEKVLLREPDRRETEGSDRKRKREKKEEVADRWERSMGNKRNSNVIETRCVDPYSTPREGSTEERVEERVGAHISWCANGTETRLQKDRGRQTKEAEEETAKSSCIVQPDLQLAKHTLNGSFLTLGNWGDSECNSKKKETPTTTGCKHAQRFRPKMPHSPSLQPFDSTRS